MEKVLVIWSGGLDSTVSVIRELYNPTVEVHTLYFELENNENKNEFEEEAIGNITYEVVHGDFELENHTYRIPEVNYLKNGQMGHYVQPYLWIKHLVEFLGEDNPSRYERIVFSFLQGDDIWMEVRELKDMYYSSMKCLFPEFIDEPYKIPRLEFPLRTWDKSDIIGWYGEYGYNYVKDLTWTCEQPKDEACGKCRPCLKRKFYEENGYDV